MKEKRGLFNVSILVLAAFVVGFGLIPNTMAHEITNIGLSPSSPAALLNNEDIDIVFDYNTTEAGGVRIYARPFTNGSLTPNYSAHSSPLYSPGEGSGTGDFTITTGDVVVDQIRFQMKNADRTVLLLEIFVPVEYHFGNSITNIDLSPPSPATLEPNELVTITFDYAAMEAAGVRIFAIPYTNGLWTPNFAISSSPLYPAGKGSGAGDFTIMSGSVMVDEVQFQMTNADANIVLHEFFVPVEYCFCDGQCVWHVDADAPGANVGSDWTNAFNRLQDALAVAQVGDEIRVAEGTYRPDANSSNPSGTGDRTATFQLINGVAVKGGYAGFGEPDPDARDIEAYETILSGDLKSNDGPNFTNYADNSYHVVTSSFNDATAVLDGFTISGGGAEGAYPDYIGGGMHIPIGSPTVSNCLFTNNSSEAGGGLAAHGAGSPTLTNCVFLANTAQAGTGGAVDLQHSSPTLISCMILGNTAGGGAGLRTMNNDDTPTLRNCVFSGNSATDSGGGIFNSGVGGGSNPNPPVLTNCTVSENSAALEGGGLYNEGGADAVVNSCIFWGNSDTGGTDESAQIYTSSIAPAIDYTCVQGLTGALGGAGNIGDNPTFVDSNGPDDIVGTADDNLRLMLDSPCIDAGHPGLEYQDLDGTRNDMGAYGGPWGDVAGAGSHAGSGFVFTSIGSIPSSEITQDDPCDPNHIGLANVDPNVHHELGIHEYKDSPFGGRIWLHGLFGGGDNVDYYQILVGKWNDGNEPNSEDYVALNDSLTKVEYFVDPCGVWTYRYVTLGPQTIDGNDNLYQLTDEGYWSHIDLRARWNTRVYENGKYTLTYKAYRWADPCETTLVDANLPSTGWDHLILIVDNNPVTATIHNVKYDPCSPYYYDPCDGEIEECAIINLTDANENLRFTITAWHPSGYLRHYTLDNISGKNNHRGVIASDSYAGKPYVHWSGVEEQEFQSDAGSQDPWDRCAYQFRLRAWSRTTNGFGYIYSALFSDHYYLDFGGLGCESADIDGSGIVDFRDVARLAHYWLASCGP